MAQAGPPLRVFHPFIDYIPHRHQPAVTPSPNSGCTVRPLLYTLLLLTLLSCSGNSGGKLVVLWHQMPPAEREVLEQQLQAYEFHHPGVRVRALYKETEELRSGFQAAALAGAGPDLIYGPSDVLGSFQTMGIIRDMSPWFPATLQDEFVPEALTFLPSTTSPDSSQLVQVGDRIGNHLALVINRNLLADTPATTDDMIRMAVEQTVDSNGDGRNERYGLVWNFVEPFFVIPFLTGHGAWIFAEQGGTVPSLDTPEAVAAYTMVLELQDRWKVIPANCDYETADALFKSGQAAMIINGDWSWGDYLANPRIQAEVVPLPVVNSTGLPMGPMVATKGYSLNVNVDGDQARIAMDLVTHLTSTEVQATYMGRLKTLPSRKSLLQSEMLVEDPTLRASAVQMANGRPMPVVAELRAIWDSMRPSYQALLGGSKTPAEAARDMQAMALESIDKMNRKQEQGVIGKALTWAGWLLLAGVLVWQRHTLPRFLKDWKSNRLAYIFILPSLVVILLTIVFPFLYNVVLSLSNMSLRHFRDWEVTGFQNYVEVFREAIFFSVLAKTVVWTVVNLVFHVGLGVLLAVMLNGPIKGKSIYRVLLIIPWAVPAYITALTWRGMFDYEYGAINLVISQFLSMPMVNWLGSPFEAFLACILTNIWLGFPFMMVITLGGLQGIPQELYEAARVDGASRWDQFRLITLPLLKPVLLPAITLGAIWTFNNLNVVWLVSNGGEPSDQTHILVSYVYKAVFNLYRYGYGAALSMVIFVILAAFSVGFLKRSKATQSVY